jgi:hypothetical protein
MATDSGFHWAFFMAGLAVQAGALLLARNSLRSLRAGGRARGRVVANEEEWGRMGSGPGRMFHFPVVSFTTLNGEKLTFRSTTGEGRPKAVGSEVTVLYDPENPSGATLGTFTALWFFPVALSLVGMPFLILGLMGLLG